MRFYFRSLIDQYFGGSLDVELKCVENDDEAVSKSKEQFLQLSCFISQELRYMHLGLKNVSCNFENGNIAVNMNIIL